MEEKQITSAGKKIVYFKTGEGAPVVLVHGFAESHTVWALQAAALSKKYMLIMPELPGTGASDMLADVSMENMAALINEICNAEKLEKFVLIGHSMGGYIALAYAEKYPEKLSGFGLFHSSAYADNLDKIASREKGISFIEKHGAAAFLSSTVPNVFSEAHQKNNPELIQNFISALPAFNNETLIAYYRAMMARPDRTKILEEATIPVLFIIGEHDSAIPYEDALKQSTMPAYSHIQILHNSGHMGMLEETEKANAALQDYLQDVYAKSF